MLMKRYLEKAHVKDTALDRAWTFVEFLENEARDHITNKCEAERDTDEKDPNTTAVPHAQSVQRRRLHAVFCNGKFAQPRFC